MKASLEQRDESYIAAATDNAVCELLLNRLLKVRRVLLGGVLFTGLLTLATLLRPDFMHGFQNIDPLQPDTLLLFAFMMFFEAVWFSFDTRVKFPKALVSVRKSN